MTDADPHRNAYGTVEDRYQLTAYDCSDPTEVQAYSSVPERPCSVRATPVQRTRPTRFQLLQKEKKRYLTAYSCSILRTELGYNCGVYGHAELDPIHWSSSVIQRVTFEQCLTWLRTRRYQPSTYSVMMHGRDLNFSIALDEPNQVSYMVRGLTYTKLPSLPTDQVSETACQGEWVEYEQGHPFNHMVAYYDRVMLQSVTLVVEGDEVVDQRNQWTLPCKWADGQCHAEGMTYVWNTTADGYCQVALVREFLGHRLRANVSEPAFLQDPQKAEAIVSAEGDKKIRLRPLGPSSQCGRVVTATNVEDMFLFPIIESNDQGNIVLDNRDRVFTRAIHPSEVDLHKYITNQD